MIYSENEFMADMIDQGEVLVDAKKLRAILQRLREWERVVDMQNNRIKALEATIEVLKLEKAEKNYVKVDLKV